MEREDERTQPSTGDEERRDRTRAVRVNEVMTVERDLGESGEASDPDRRRRRHTEGVDELEPEPERNPEVARESGSIRSFLRGRAVGNGDAFHAFTSLSCSSSSSPCPSPSALLSTLSLSSSSPQPSLAPPLKLDAVLVDERLVLDVYQHGGAAMSALWESAPERMKRVQYVRLGSEDEGALEGSLGVLPHLTQLRSLAIRGTRTHTFSICNPV